MNPLNFPGTDFLLNQDHGQIETAGREPYKRVDNSNPLLNYVISELEINTPDSIQLACGTLQNHGIESAKLISLLNLQMNTSGADRNEEFAAKIKSLSEEIQKEIKDILKK